MLTSIATFKYQRAVRDGEKRGWGKLNTHLMGGKLAHARRVATASPQQMSTFSRREIQAFFFLISLSVNPVQSAILSSVTGLALLLSLLPWAPVVNVFVYKFLNDTQSTCSGIAFASERNGNLPFHLPLIGHLRSWLTRAQTPPWPRPPLVIAIKMYWVVTKGKAWQVDVMGKHTSAGEVLIFERREVRV